MTKKHRTIPPEAMEPDFITALRDSYVQQHPVARRLLIASTLADELGRSYLAGALSMDREAIREILLGKFDYQPGEYDEYDEDEIEDVKRALDHRAPAAFLFLYGVSAGYWPATAEEKELARALVFVAYGKEALDMLTPEKTKADLAREAGVPNETFVYKVSTGDKSLVEGRTSKQIVDDYLYIQKLCDEAELIAARKPIDLDAIGVAFGDYLAALKRYFPKAYEAQTARLRKQFAPVVAKTIVELIEKAPATASAMLEIIK